MRGLESPQTHRRVTIELGAADATGRRNWKKHLELTAVTCLSRLRYGVTTTPRTRTASATSTTSFASVSRPALSGSQSRLLPVPIHNHSVFSMLSLRRLADIQWLIAVTQRSRAATDRFASSVLQLKYN